MEKERLNEEAHLTRKKILSSASIKPNTFQHFEKIVTKFFKIHAFFLN